MKKIRKKCKPAIALLIVVVLTLSTASVIFAADMPEIGFEDGTASGFSARGSCKVTVTDEDAKSGTYSLLTTGRTDTWNGPSLEVTKYVVPGVSCNVSVWVKLKSPDKALLVLSTQIGEGADASYHNIASKEVSGSNGWVELSGAHIYGGDVKYATIYIESPNANAEFYIDDISFKPASNDGLAESIAQPSLYETYKDYFLLGSAFESPDLTGARFDLVKKHFNVLTFGNSMKPDALGGREKGAFNFGRVDGIIDTLDDAGILLHGHTLVWHSQSARWLNRATDGSPLTRSEARSNMEYYINNVAGHYAGRVISWDVLNEAFVDYLGSVPSDWRNGLRKDSPWYMAYENGAADGEDGSDYIYDAFVFARAADPNAVLYYNDFNEESKGKREAIAMMTEELNAKWKEDSRNTEPDRLLIEGLGMQAHYWTDHLNPRDVEDTIIRWIETGAEISVSELDIPAGSYSGFKQMDEALEQKQARLYAELFQIYKKYSDNIVRVSIWGIDDPTSWRSEGNPLLFDAEGYPKPAFFAVLDPEGFLGQDATPVATATPAPTSPPEATPAEELPTPTAVPADTETVEKDDNSTMWVIIIIGIVAGVAMIATAIILSKRKR